MEDKIIKTECYHDFGGFGVECIKCGEDGI